MSKTKKGQRAEVLRILRDRPRKDEPMTNHKELRERAEAFRDNYPDHFKPMDTLGYVADANDLIRDLLAALDEQQRMIERLPVTADGVRVVPGIRTYFIGSGLIDPRKRVQETDIWAMRTRRGWTFENCVRMSTGPMYSTRESAEAAKEADND